MKREDLFLTKEQCLYLQELGLDMSDANYAWVKWADTIDNAGESYSVEKIEFPKNITIRCITEKIPTYTLQEIFEKLPKDIKPNNCGIPSSYYPYADLGDDYVVYSEIFCIGDDEGGCTIGYEKKRDTLMESAYNMLVWCLENKYL